MSSIYTSDHGWSSFIQQRRNEEEDKFEEVQDLWD